MADSLRFSKSLFSREFAFSMDFGSSAIKLVYTAVEGDNLGVHFASFPNSKLDEALTFMKDKAEGHICMDEEMAICGAGASREIQKISQSLNSKLKTIPEGDAGLTAFQFMARHLPWHAIVYPSSQTASQYGAELSQQFADVIIGISHGKFRPWSYMADVPAHVTAVNSQNMLETVQYPILLAGVGSGFTVGKMLEDGTFEMCTNINGPAGRTFLGLGSLLTGAKDFTELVELAEHGNASHVDQWLKSLDVNPDDNLYNSMQGSDLKLFAFGHAIGRNIDVFKREDLAAAVVSLIAVSAANEAYFWAAHHKIKQVFFCGGFAVSTAYVRQEIEKEFTMRKYANSIGHLCDCHFLKQGAHLGALGVLMQNLHIREAS